MIRVALIFITAAVHFVMMTPTGKYFLVETRENKEIGDGGAIVDNEDTEENFAMTTKQKGLDYDDYDPPCTVTECDPEEWLDGRV